MKRYLLFCFLLAFCFSVLPYFLIAQADNCNTPATLLTPNASTCNPTAGNTYSATASTGAPACTGSADDDVWYRFTTAAGSNMAFIYVDVASSGFDPVFQVLSGACGSQSSIGCVDAGGSGVDESFVATSLSPSTQYYVRVYGYGNGNQYDGAFNICVVNGSPPSNDNCSGATTLTPGATCSPTNGTSAWATSSGIAACTGNPDDDVWYQFTANATYERIRVVPDANMDAVVQVFSRTGVCSGLTSIACQNSVGAGGAEDFYVPVTSGQIYYVRVYHFGAYYGNMTNSGTFTICVQGGAPPANDNCAAAVNLPANGSCVNTSGTSTFATPSGTGTACVGQTVDDDVWYSFTAINNIHTITVTPNAVMDAQIQILEGACGSLLSKQCQDAGGTGVVENMSVTNLTIGNVYYVRISHKSTYYGFGASPSGSFTICNVATTPIAGDNPCGALLLPTPTSACIYGTYNLTGSTLTATPGTPGCSWGNKDIWFKVQVPGSGPGAGIIDINGFLSTGGIADQVMAVYYSNVVGVDNCNALTYLGCNDDYIGPCGGITQSQFAVGGAANYWIYIRCGLYSGSALNDGKFKLCVTSPSNDECATPTFVCDMNGFRGTTNMSYGNIWAPPLLTNWEEQQIAGNYGGPYGTGGTSIENPSWLMFEASATTASLTLTVSECYCGWGVQFQVLAGGTCNGAVGSWTAKSSWPGSNVYAPGSTTITANGLTIGSTYYCLVDGFAGDLCNYQINGATGIGTTVLVTPASSSVSLCSGQTTTLSIDPVGSGGTVSWSSTPAGYSGSGTSVVVNPATSPGVTNGTVTYLATVTGNCITPQTVSANVTVNATPPAPTITATPTALCGATSLGLSASAANANAFEWFDAASGGNSLGNGTSYTPVLNDNQIGSYTWYASGYNNTGNPACTSSTRGSITIPINSWGGKIKWTGNAPASTPNWTNTNNWFGCTPSCTNTIGVIIPDQATVTGPNKYPVISSGVTTDDLLLEANGRLDLTTGGTLAICGSFGHYGALTIPAGSPSITFGGTQMQFYAKTSTGSGDLPNVTMNNPAGLVVADGAGNLDMDIRSASTLALTNGIITTQNTRTVNVKNSAVGAVTGFGASSYVNGRLKRAISAPPLSYDFPVGTSTGYERMKIDFTAGTTITNATTYFEKPSNALGAGLGSLNDAGVSFMTTSPGIVDAGAGSNGGLWTVIPSAGTANYNMTLYGTNYTNAGSFTHTIVKRDQFCPGNWSLPGTYASSSVGGGVITAARTGMSGFSQFGIGRHSSALPVTLLFFDAACKNNEVKITWLTASEINNDYFTIERATLSGNQQEDVLNWLSIGTVNGVGNSSTVKNYEFIDNSPFLSEATSEWAYRIKQTDFDGKYEYFDAATVSCNRNIGFSVSSIVPNPAKDNLFIFFYSDNTEEQVTIHITDMLGKILVNEKIIPVEGLNQQQIDISNLSNGVYFVRVSNEIKNHIEKIVKQY